MTARITTSCILLTLLLAGSASARTWHINTAGTGDAPTIAAGADSAVAGDTILVAPGNYSERDILIGPGVVLMSEDGPTATRIMEEAADVTYGVGCYQYPAGSPGSEVCGFWFEGFTNVSGALGVAGPYTNVTMRENVLTENDFGLVTNLQCHVTVENCTFVDNRQAGLNIVGGDVQLEYSIVWDHQAGGVTALFVDYRYPGDAGGNINLVAFSEDPQFCGPLVGNYYLQDDSPCAPGNFDPMVGLIGALPVACGPVKAEPSSWGKVKSLYR